VATPRNYSVIKAFAILKAFGDSEGWLSSGELSRRANLPHASGYRLIQTMVDIGAITRGKRGQYRPGLLLLSISRGVPLLDLLRDASKNHPKFRSVEKCDTFLLLEVGPEQMHCQAVQSD
jgi:hypothetical protein